MFYLSLIRHKHKTRQWKEQNEIRKWTNVQSLTPKCYPGSQRFSKRRATKHEAVKREKIDKRWENLWLPATVNWSYHANRFELGSRPDPASWLEEPYWCVIIGCLLIDLVMLIDTHHSMIVRFKSPATRGFLSSLSLSSLFTSKETSGPRAFLSPRGE